MKNVLLIGGSGFLGSAISKSFSRSGEYIIHVLARNVEPQQDNRISYYRGSQDEIDMVAPLLNSCQTVIHLASTSTPGTFARKPLLEVEQNLLPAARLLDIMSNSPPKQLIFISSGGSIYGNPPQIPVNETKLPKPLSYHAAGKLALESLFSTFAYTNSIPLAIARPSNIYGPGQPLKSHFGLIRTLLDKALTGNTVDVWGSRQVVRDYLYIDDAVAAVKNLIDVPTTNGVFNLGSGTGTSIEEVINLVEDVTNCELIINERPARRTDVSAIVLDSSHLSEVTGWKAKVNLRDGISMTWNWLRKHHG